MPDSFVSKLTDLNLLRALFLGGIVLATSCAVNRSAQGIWTGTIGAGTPKPAGVRFALNDDNNGKLSGEIFFQDPVTNEFGNDGSLAGTRDGTSATWTTETNVMIKGTFEDNKFTGTIEFPPEEGRPVHAPIPLTLNR